MSDGIIISMSALLGVGLMCIAIFAKRKDVETSSPVGTDDLFTAIASLVFAFSPIIIKRILLFLFGLLWTGVFLYILISGEY